MGRYEIAGLTVDMDVSGRTARQAIAYAADSQGPADITLSCDNRRVLEMNPQLGSEDMAEYMGTGAMFARHLLEFGGFQLHASAVILEGKAYLFSAPSGVGKSTHTEKWQRLFGAEYLNDDKPALRQIAGEWMVYGTPWSGKYDLSVPKSAPLGGVTFLRRAEENQMEPLTPAQALPLLMSQTVSRLRREQMQLLLPMADQLLRQVPIWMLSCRNEDAAAVLSHDIMTKQGA